MRYSIPFLLAFLTAGPALGAQHIRPVSPALHPSAIGRVPIVPVVSIKPLTAAPLSTGLLQAVPTLTLQAPSLQALPSAESLPAPAVPSLPALMPAAAPDESGSEGLNSAFQPDSPLSGKTLALGGLFDGSIPILGGGTPGLDVQTFNGAYGLYSYLSGLEPVTGASNPGLAKARILLEFNPLLEKGPIILTREGESLTALSERDPTLPPITVSLAPEALTAEGASPRAKSLAGKLETAAQLDESEPGRFAVAELLNSLSAIAVEEPAVEPEKPGLEAAEDIPLDPRRRPHEFLGRLLRDAVRAETPEAALKLLSAARTEAGRLLNYQDRVRFLGRLQSHGRLLADQYVSGLLEGMQFAAAESDRAEVNRRLALALEFVEYAPAWEKRVLKAREAAMNTLAILKEYGPLDEETGLPVPQAEPETDPDAPRQKAAEDV